MAWRHIKTTDKYGLAGSLSHHVKDKFFFKNFNPNTIDIPASC